MTLQILLFFDFLTSIKRFSCGRIRWGRNVFSLLRWSLILSGFQVQCLITVLSTWEKLYIFALTQINSVWRLLVKVPYPACLTLPCPTYPTLTYPALPCPTYPTLPYPALPCPALPWPALTWPALPYPTLPCPALPLFTPQHLKSVENSSSYNDLRRRRVSLLKPFLVDEFKSTLNTVYH